MSAELRHTACFKVLKHSVWEWYTFSSFQVFKSFDTHQALSRVRPKITLLFFITKFCVLVIKRIAITLLN